MALVLNNPMVASKMSVTISENLLEFDCIGCGIRSTSPGLKTGGPSPVWRWEHLRGNDGEALFTYDWS